MDFDAIVVGSGISGGWVAKELTGRGLKVLVVERGRDIRHGPDYTDFVNPWERETGGLVNEDETAADYPIQSQCYAFESATKHWWVKDSEHPYITPPGRPFAWIRGYHVGGRSLMWARQCYRWSDIDFGANKKDGHGVDWPIRYADIAPWYDHVEEFAGISGAAEGLPQLPDGRFQPPMAFSCVEEELKRRIEATFPTRRMTIGRCAHLTAPTPEQLALGRSACMYRNLCTRGCSFGAYFSSLSATLPAAQRTGNLTLAADSICHSVIYDQATKRASAVRVVDANSKAGRTYTGRMVFLCASSIASAQILLNSASAAFPDGLANHSGMVGRNLMDHIGGIAATGVFPGLEDRYHEGRRPNGIYIPRYVNVTEPTDAFVRGFGFQGAGMRPSWQRGTTEAGVGAELKSRLRNPGPWSVRLAGFGEMLPNPDNRVTLDRTRKDKWGIPLLHIDCGYGPNELALTARAERDAGEMLRAAGCINVQTSSRTPTPGLAIHEMGTARMGRDPATSVLNDHNQAHDVPNLFVTDGACMASTACHNPSLTYMALSARAANHAADRLQAGTL